MRISTFFGGSGRKADRGPRHLGRRALFEGLDGLVPQLLHLLRHLGVDLGRTVHGRAGFAVRPLGVLLSPGRLADGLSTHHHTRRNPASVGTVVVSVKCPFGISARGIQPPD